MVDDPETTHWVRQRLRLAPKWKFWWRWYVGFISGGIVALLIALILPRFIGKRWVVSAIGAATATGTERILTAIFPPPPPSWAGNSSEWPP